MSHHLTTPLQHLPDPLPIPTIPSSRAPFSISIRPPGSKSLTNRALLLAALANGSSTIHDPLIDADDPQRMIAALTALGSTIQLDPASNTARITGVAGRWRVPPQGLTLNLNNAGTATRFLAAASLLAPSPITIDGNERMRERPIAELIDALEALGSTARYSLVTGCPPVTLTPPTSLPAAASLEIPTTISSQFISALLLVAPWLPGGLTLRLLGEVTSEPYIRMTLGLLDRLGASVRTAESLSVIRVGSDNQGSGLHPFTLHIEPDASGATYFWAAAALFPGAVTHIEPLDRNSLQGDAKFPELLERMGAVPIYSDDPENSDDANTAASDHPASIGLRGGAAIAPITADLAHMPDAAMTLASVACFASGRSILRGLRTLRVKETDRIEAMRAELAKIGVRVEANVLGDPGAITITPPKHGVDCSPAAPPVEFETYHDHRMAMSLALIALRRPNTFIRDPACVAKTYPTFWQDLARLF